MRIFQTKFDMKNLRLPDLRDAFKKIAPRISDRRFIFQQLLTSIGHCEKTGSCAWSATLLEYGFRLNVGQVEVLTCYFYPFAEPDTFKTDAEDGLACLRVLVSGMDESELIEKVLPSFEVAVMSYQSVSKAHWCVSVLLPFGRMADDEDHAAACRILALIQSAHANFVVDAAHTSSGKLRKASNFSRFNSPTLFELARETLSPKFTYELAMAGFIDDDELLLSDIPGKGDTWDSIGPFALTFAGDAGALGGKSLQDIIEERTTAPLTMLRQSLYDFQRAWRWNDCPNLSDQQLALIHCVVDEIRDRVQRVNRICS